MHEGEDRLAVEEPLEIRINGTSLAVVMRTPGDDAELACGFLFTEQIIEEHRDIVQIRSGVDELGLEANNCIDITLRKAVNPKEEGWQRNFYAASSCGVCGKSTIAMLRAHCLPVNGKLQVPAAMLCDLPERLLEAQSGFAQTGGLHAAGLFTATGEAVVLREDIGRHNAVDKVIGWALLNGHLPLSEMVLMVSGRTSFEIVQKAWVSGVPVVAGISAASSLAVELAREAGMTLIGFLREGRMSVYCGEERVV
jgi:FdhD protein